MKQLLLGVWLLFRSLAKVLQFAIDVVLFLGAAAEITSLALNHGSFLMENIKNVAALFQRVEVTATTQEPQPQAAPQCLRSEKRLVDLRCGEKPNPADRILCKVTVPPTEIICVEHEPRS